MSTDTVLPGGDGAEGSCGYAGLVQGVQRAVTIYHRLRIDELSKIMLIVTGVTRTTSSSQFQSDARGSGRAGGKGIHTLGAGDFDVAYRVVLKQIAPRVLNSIRLNLKAVMLFLFAGEMIASTDGLAYRIALLRRHMGMDVIIPYVLWVALLLFLVDLGMRLLNRKLHPSFTEA
jgi:NitT/TauT family transport system permease protein